MADYNINYIRSEAGYELKPDLNKLLRYSIPTCSHIELSKQLKELIHIEVQVEHHKRAEKAKVILLEVNTNKDISPQIINNKSTPSKTELKSKLIQQTQQLAKPIVMRDFFGRIIPTQSDTVKSKKSTSTSPTKMILKKATILYKYHEGSTNAVRRTTYVKDFLIF